MHATGCELSTRKRGGLSRKTTPHLPDSAGNKDLSERNTLSSPDTSISRPSFYYGWVQMLVAAAAMVGTLPGRTQGLGLVTEPLLQDMGLSRVAFAEFNLWATLIGALFRSEEHTSELQSQ